MRDYHVGNVVVVESRGKQRIPLGVLTDRDVAIKVIAENLDPDGLSLRDVMSTPLITAREDEELLEVIGRMRSQGVRRVPVVNEDGGLEGILAVDDVLELLAEQMNGLTGLVQAEQQHERVRHTSR
jgi:CBS domain-containing protein